MRVLVTGAFRLAHAADATAPWPGEPPPWPLDGEAVTSRIATTAIAPGKAIRPAAIQTILHGSSGWARLAWFSIPPHYAPTHLASHAVDDPQSRLHAASAGHAGRPWATCKKVAMCDLTNPSPSVKILGMGMTLLQLADRLRDDADAYEYLEGLRWAGNPTCAHCGADRPYFLTPKNGIDRRTTRGTVSQRRVWKCRSCRKQFSVLTGTIFHGTKIPLRIWVLVIFEMASSKNGVAAREIERKYGLTPKSAWFMMHRIREAMKREPMAGLLTGRVVADETYIGGKPRNRHGGTRPGRRNKSGAGTDKTPVFALVSRETGEVVTKVMPNVTGKNLAAAIRGEVDPERVILHTDDSINYFQAAQIVKEHHSVNHREHEFVRGDVSTNQAENFFSQLKRSIDGTHHHVSVDHLPRYLAEFGFRYTFRKESDTQRMARLVRQVDGRRLMYREPGQAWS